ncbi:S41 family peptidase [Rhodospirillaceae bacterium KN72]|uniref:S41 family peptidase n=1 Tax=Pacificispira spongiicola TaxID=2729598 RepID=A0A7Y0E1Y8_9PROT|nr:S41 family peptidase [Pacificispira spongiicola]
MIAHFSKTLLLSRSALGAAAIAAGLGLTALPATSWLTAPAFAQENDGAPAAAPSDAPPMNEPDTFELLDLFGEVFNRVREEYVEEISDKQLIEAAIRGLVGSLDPHSTYLDEESFDAMQTHTKGEFGGLGIEVSLDESGLVKVVSPIDDTPAAKAGILAGDLISHLDGDPVKGMTLNDAVEHMRGPVGADITLTIIREGVAEPFEVVLTRDKIQIQSVRSRMEGDIGYIRITSFSGQTQSGLEKAIATIQEEGGDGLLGYILDLRNNPGGLLNQGVSVADTFLQHGEIVSTRGRNTENIQRFQATPGDLTDGMPLVVLINGGSASASEIVAGALQDQHRAIILGTRSFGKGSVQTITPLSRNGAALKLTTQRFYTPSGKSIQQLGISPDIVVERARVEVLEGGFGRSEKDLAGSLKNENGEVEQETLSGTDTQIEDYQLARALDLVRGIGLYRSQSQN